MTTVAALCTAHPICVLHNGCRLSVLLLAGGPARPGQAVRLRLAAGRWRPAAVPDGRSCAGRAAGALAGRRRCSGAGGGGGTGVPVVAISWTTGCSAVT